MKKLKDLGYKYKPKDGRKRFTGDKDQVARTDEQRCDRTLIMKGCADEKRKPDCYKAGTRRQGEKVFYQPGGNTFHL